MINPFPRWFSPNPSVRVPDGSARVRDLQSAPNPRRRSPSAWCDSEHNGSLRPSVTITLEQMKSKPYCPDGPALRTALEKNRAASVLFRLLMTTAAPSNGGVTASSSQF
ncbi:hypothetical protein XELAEV_18045471mg [Xenopus laevis]|uniref:Uncharacterized protein n=1 Tax=Xenopus laevis TaxID=8355 RepID=A0A974H4B0_XENLA|nr:hypothetical protein XELAEV_18045471mg [Xenopus laevis]